MHAELIAAIRQRRVVSFLYQNRRRDVVPCRYGEDARGNVVLLGHEPRGGLQVFQVNEMRDLQVLDLRFSEPPRTYRRPEVLPPRTFAQL